MIDFLMLALLAAAFAGATLYVRICAAVTDRSGASRNNS